MTDPVSRSQLEAAVSSWDEFGWGPGFEDLDAEVAVETAKAVLSAPTAELCEVHRSERWTDYDGEQPGSCIVRATDNHTTPGPCSYQTVALVPMEEGGVR